MKKALLYKIDFLALTVFYGIPSSNLLLTERGQSIYSI